MAQGQISPNNVKLSFPDGSIREYPVGVTGKDVAESIAKSLAKKSVAYALDGELRDLVDPIEADGALELVTRTDEKALELIRHDAAHVMAEAVQELWPGTQVTIGPVIENGFYYDFAKDEPFTPEDLPVIEKKMREIIARNKPFTKEVWSRDEAKAHFEKQGESYKVELVDAIPADQDLKMYKQGEWMDLCRGPHMRSTNDIGNAFKLMSVAGAYWRGDSNNAMLTRIYGTAWADEDSVEAVSSYARGSRQARSPQAGPRDEPVPLSGRGTGRCVLAFQGLETLSEPCQLYASPP